MNLIDRFTRDRVSRVVWSLALIALAGVFAASVVMEGRARDAELSSVGDRAGRELIGLLEPTLGNEPIEQDLSTDARSEIGAAVQSLVRQEAVIKVRLWRSGAEGDAFAVFSSDAREAVPSSALENDELIARAAAGGGTPLVVVGGPRPHAYVLLTDSQLVGEAVLDRNVVLADVDAFWGAAKAATAAAAGLVFLLLMLSFRPVVAPIGAGVPFVAENLPSGKALIDRDRLDAVEDVYALAQQRVDKLKERLQLAENERQFLQGELQRALSGLPSTAAPVAAAPMPEPRRSEFVKPAPMVEAEFEPMAEPEPAPSPAAAPTAKQPRKRKPRPRSEPAPAAEPERAEPTPDAAEILAAAAEVGEVVEAASAASEEPEPPVIELPESEVVAATRPEREAAAIGAWAYPGTPEPAERRRSPEPPATSASELLDRLMASETHEIGGPHADPGRIREQIARVAAKKKPGGGEAKKLFQGPEGPKPPWMHDRDKS